MGYDKRELERACKRAGVPRVTPNDLRRTFATWLKQSDVDSAVVAAMMGHTSTAMDRVYGKLDEASYRRAIAKYPVRRNRGDVRFDDFCHAADRQGLEHDVVGPRRLNVSNPRVAPHRGATAS